jgi:phospholipid/cholesterol/gamma-HCH transport system permease protein
MQLLTAIFNVAGIYGGYAVGVSLLDVSSGTYFGAMERSIVFHDVFGGLLNSVSLGLIITWILLLQGIRSANVSPPQ